MMKYKSVYCIKQNTKEVLCVIGGILRVFDWTCSRDRIHKPLFPIVLEHWKVWAVSKLYINQAPVE